MLVFVIPVCIGAAVGLVRGGRIDHVTRLRFRVPLLILVALVVQASLGHAPAGARVPLVLVTYAVAGGWTAMNWGGRDRSVRLALAFVVAGWALNLAVMAPNGAMPVSARALERLGVRAGYDVENGHLSKHRLSDAGTPLRWLGDTIAVPPLRAVISVGDIVLAIGIATMVVSAMGVGVTRRRLLAGAAEASG